MTNVMETEHESLGQNSPEAAMSELTYLALTRYIEARNSQEVLPGIVWLSSQRMQRPAGEPDEQVMWLRLGEGDELLPGVDWFDLGVAVIDPTADRPLPVEHNPAERHFFVRRHQVGYADDGVVDMGNILQAAYDTDGEGLPVQGLIRKLQQYRLHGTRVLPDSVTPRENAA